MSCYNWFEVKRRMKCLMLLQGDLSAGLYQAELNHPALVTSDVLLFQQELKTDLYYMLIVEYPLLTPELCSLLQDRPDCVQLHVITTNLDFDSFHNICEIRGTEIYNRADFLAKPSEAFNRLIEKGCQDFYDELFFLLYQAAHSTDATLTPKLLPRLRLWDEQPMHFGLLRFPEEYHNQVETFFQEENLLCIHMDQPSELFVAIPHDVVERARLMALLQRLSACCSCSDWSFGISTLLKEGEGLCTKVDETKTALMRRFYCDEHLCFYQPGFFAVHNDYVRLIALEKQLSNAILSCFEVPHLLRITEEYIQYFADMLLLPPLVYDSVYRFLNSLDRVFKYIDPLCTINVDMVHPSDISANQTLTELHGMLERLFTQFVEMSGGNQKETAISVPRLQSYLNDHISEELSLDRIAREFFIDKFFLCKSYKQQTGIGLWNYLMKIRMERAADLLVNTQQKVHVIAQQVGYQDSSYFSSVFRKFHGLTPKEYREARRAEAD